MSDSYPVIEIKLDDTDIRRLPARLALKAERAVKRVTLLCEAQAVRNAPHKTQNLVNSITSEISGSGFNTVGRVKATAPYALFQELGTGIFGPKQAPFVVRAVSAKALYWPGAAHPVKSVTIRGVKGKFYMKKAFEQEGPKLRDLIFD